MKVLLLGEFSGFFKYLKAGLQENGVNVDWYAGGDSFKKITGMDGDIQGHTGIKIVDKILYPFYLVSKLKGYDVVQLVNPLIFSPWINAFLIRKLQKNNKLLVVSAVGTDYSVYKYQKQGKREFEYYLLDDCDDYDIYYAAECKYTRDYEAVMECCDAIIPGSYEYALAYQDNSKRMPIIHYPIDLAGIEYKENVVGNKIVFFHGLSREVFKGTKYIREALEILKEKYPDEVEVIIDGHMPFEQYLSVMQKANVIIDQCKSYGPGINALIAMAQGKIVLGGSEQGAVEEGKNCPIWNITPDKEQIFSVLEQIVINKDKIPLWGEEARKYVEKHHNNARQAADYIKAWKSLM